MFEVVVVTMQKLEEIRRCSQPQANSSDCFENIIPSFFGAHKRKHKPTNKKETHTRQEPKYMLYTSARLTESTLCRLLVHILL